MIAIMENKILKTGNGDNTEIIQTVNISELKPYEQQPFKVLIDESMEEIMESIKQNGVLSPIIARPHPDVIDSIMQEQKPEKIKITLAGDKVKKYFPEDYTEKQIEDVMIKLLDDWYKKRQRKKEYER